ncbi:hypothetical protein IPJ72_01460 [Candidatus Peregrinibacteria bacterium]|nr:MAG: hypothetical protein IPJ72_01460 [Candidatus Peregrinibacteria bacterium]
MENSILITKVQNSLIDDTQKKELIDLIPQMSDEEKSGVAKLVEVSNETLKNAEEKFQNDLKQLNQKTNLTLERVQHEEIRNAINAFEELDSKKSADSLSKVEAEMDHIDTMPSQKKERPKASAKKSGKWFFSVLFSIVVLIGIVLFLITKL